ncbi:uncharacterized histidine-rich protein DDB_G0274557-like isoform X2 [Sitodiplosis mosellana]|uniref:uncharacterized histidine-rich protein DDB_G0274557-like isoform X2 n=1 Tax=Sitodiplosis mosellana TaxID=263140 RepID=UPI0024445FC9|nr:uncharacterized histidine-rich protein DDB_G0274557-like isoform X2 [Sitodiplosis mosellana]
MLLRISFVVAMVCVWCVIGETMPKVISNRLNKNETMKSQAKVDVNIAARERSPRQLDPNDWVPFQPPIPAVWNPRPRSPLYTWFGAPFPFDGTGALIRVRPPGAYIPPEEIGHHHDYHHDYHHDKHHDKHHDYHHHKPLYHHRPVPPPPPPPLQSPLLPGLQGPPLALRQDLFQPAQSVQSRSMDQFPQGQYQHHHYQRPSRRL